jgi:regulator of RNase E activity RraA
MWSPKRQEGNTKIVGRAYTVKYALLDDPAPKIAKHYVRMFSLVRVSSCVETGAYKKIDEIPKGSVIFISSPPNLPNAVYGGLMSNRAKASGAVGTVVDGRIRDLNEHREIGMPVSPVQQT